MFDIFDEPPAPENRLVKLELLTLAHSPGLAEVALHESVWRYSVKGLKHFNEKGVEHYVRNLLQEFEYRNAATFVIVSQETGRAAGCIKFEQITPRHQRINLGGGWLGLAERGKGLFRAAAYELMDYAFDEGDAYRVGFEVDANNEAGSRAANALGATEEGVLRKYAITANGDEQHVRVFSVLDDEWPPIKTRLRESLRLD